MKGATCGPRASGCPPLLGSVCFLPSGLISTRIYRPDCRAQQRSFLFLIRRKCRGRTAPWPRWTCRRVCDSWVARLCECWWLVQDGSGPSWNFPLKRRSSAGLSDFTVLQLDASLMCPGRRDLSCAHWDRTVQLFVCCDPLGPYCNVELGRWITAFRRSLKTLVPSAPNISITTGFCPTGGQDAG